jgi:hypothetical protein
VPGIGSCLVAKRLPTFARASAAAIHAGGALRPRMPEGLTRHRRGTASATHVAGRGWPTANAIYTCALERARWL